MTDKTHITTTAVNFRDWILGTGEFSEENLKKDRDEFFAKLGKHWSDLMLASLDKAFSDLDAVPEARAKSCDDCGPHATPELGNPVLAPPQDGTGNTQEPVAWAVTIGPPNKVSVYEAFAAHQKEEAIALAEKCRFGDTGMELPLAPLYFAPTLTDEEREAVEQAIDAASGMAQAEPWAAATLRKLLERLG